MQGRNFAVATVSLLLERRAAPIYTRVEVTALKHAGPAGLPGHSPLLRLQSDERLVTLVRRGNHGAFEALVGRYESRLLAFCRHMLGSREDSEDVLQEVFAASFNAMLADDRPINVRPWLYRIARNRCLNHLRRAQPIGVDSMDVHLSENGMSTADKVHRREEFRQLVSDVQELPETQRTALLLREIDALSYEQIAEAMETTVPSIKSLLVRARVSLAEAAEARLLTCEDVRYELGEVAEGLKRLSAPARRHLRTCDRCTTFRNELKRTNRALAVMLPVAPLLAFKKLILAHLGTTAAASSSAAAGTAATTAAGTAAGTAAAGTAAGGLLSAASSAVATKAVATAAAAAIVTAGVAEVKHVHQAPAKPVAVAAAVASPQAVAPPTAQATKETATKPVHHKTEKPATDKEPATVVAAVPAAAPAVPVTTTPETAPPDRTQQVSGTITLPAAPSEQAPPPLPATKPTTTDTVTPTGTTDADGTTTTEPTPATAPATEPTGSTDADGKTTPPPSSNASADADGTPPSS
jgi:RNA polymerase sigma factor (sigma-70 family)